MLRNTILRPALLGVSALLLAPTSALVPSAVYAQNVIEEILVTARKRTENLQEVPAAVSAYGSGGAAGPGGGQHHRGRPPDAEHHDQ